MSKKKRSPLQLATPRIVRLGDQLYSQSATGQMARIDPQGGRIPRVRMSKKEKLKLRKELRKINEMDSHELANKIVAGVESAPAVNPKAEGQLKKEQGEIE